MLWPSITLQLFSVLSADTQKKLPGPLLGLGRRKEGGKVCYYIYALNLRGVPPFVKNGLGFNQNMRPALQRNLPGSWEGPGRSEGGKVCYFIDASDTLDVP
jgi:hypothetical protein